MTKKDITKKVLKKIKDEKIKPKPRWEFLLKGYVFWGAFVAAIAIGAMAVSVIIFMIVTNDWEFYHLMGRSFYGFLFETLPYFWIVIFVGFLAVAYYNYRHTRKGYKYGFLHIAGISLIASIVSGLALFGVGAASHIENAALERVPMYRELTVDKRMARWAEDKGLLAGEVVEIAKDFIEVKTPTEELWTVYIKDVPEEMKENLKEGMIIGIVGTKIEEGVFEAHGIHSWRGNPPRFPQGKAGDNFMKENLGMMRIR